MLKIIRGLLSPVSVVSISGVFLFATFWLSLSAQNASDQGALYSTLLVVNILGILVILFFLAASTIRLIRQYKKRVLGSRLMVRFAVLFVVLTLLPISMVYYFSAQFLSKGVDSWFDDKIEQALDNAVLLGQGFLQASKQDLIAKAGEDALLLSRIANDQELVRQVGFIREQRAYTELDIFSQNGSTLASSNLNALSLFPEAALEADLRKAAGGEVVVKLEPLDADLLQYRILFPLSEGGLSPRSRVLQIIEPLPLRYSRLGNSLEQARSEYRRLSFLRKPLKLSFLLTLSLITLMSTLISIWLALYAARRLVAPINDLAIGTQAVAKGDYSTQLLVKSEDELGLLVGSFNSMIRKIHTAQQDTLALHDQEQKQRTYLQSVLGNLSSGVISFDQAHKLQTHNISASSILDVDLAQFIGQKLGAIDTLHSALLPFCQHLNGVMLKGLAKEQEIHLDSARGKQILAVRMSRLTESDRQVSSHNAGWVVVFDDVTKLVHAQRDAAWGEVARRLAHEIKNPLTPIALSAERIRRKYLDNLPVSERAALDRSTRTITEQVETLKRMVDAFSNYAKSERLNLQSSSLNSLVEDGVELHRQLDNSITFTLLLDESLSPMHLDPDGIRQVLNNLFGNACEALKTKKAGQIKIITQYEIQQSQNGVSLIIEDNGDGFDLEIIDRVMEPYVTTKPDGTGLGMAIVKRIVQAHSGFVMVKNHPHGGRVKVWLPLEKMV